MAKHFLNIGSNKEDVQINIIYRFLKYTFRTEGKIYDVLKNHWEASMLFFIVMVFAALKGK